MNNRTLYANGEPLDVPETSAVSNDWGATVLEWTKRGKTRWQWFKDKVSGKTASD